MNVSTSSEQPPHSYHIIIDVYRNKQKKTQVAVVPFDRLLVCYRPTLKLGKIKPHHE